MSDPVTNVEIEDVLSSIRRLVSDGAGASKSAPAVPDSPEIAPVQTDERFVLTPALRVQASEPVAEIAALEVSETDDSDGDMVDAAIDAAAEFVAPSPAPLLLTPDSKADDAPRIHDHMSEDDRASLEATIAELEAAVHTQTDDEWEPDGSEVQETSVLAAVFEAHRATEAEADSHADDEAIGSNDDHQDTTAQIAEIATSDLTNDSDVPTVEQAMAAMPDPDAPAVDETPNAQDQDVVLDAEVIVPTFRHASHDAPHTDHGDELHEHDEDGMPIPDDLDETIAAYIAGGSVLQDAEMRQLIVDVVREELRGELGERITRNVRKMVRREVLRALQTNGIS